MLTTEHTNRLQIVIDSPEGQDRRILEDPSIKNREQTHFFALLLQFDDHLLCNQDTFAHSAEAIGALWLHRTHRRYALLRQLAQLLLAKRTVPNHRGIGLKVIR